MAHKKRIEFGNYTLKFGEHKVLLDLIDEVVMPSFFEMKYVRKLKGKGDYFFIDTKLIKLEDDENAPVVGITGRIVKNTKLKREQIFREDGGIIEDRSELETAPSSTFVLILNNHRLAFCKEVPGAPTMQNFQSTSQFCLKNQHKEYIQEIFESAKETRLNNADVKRVTKKSLIEKYPYPILRITPLSDTQNLRDFVYRFKHIDEILIKLLPTNKEEIDNDEFWADFGRRREQLNSNTATARFSNPKDGLDAKAVFSQTSAASHLGNSTIKFKGTDGQGDTISGNNDDFSLSVEVMDIPKSTEKAAIFQYNSFKNLVNSGVIALPLLAEETLNKIKSIFERL